MKPSHYLLLLVLGFGVVALTIAAVVNHQTPAPVVIPEPDPMPEVKPAPKPNKLARFNIWFDGHQKTCPQCSKMADDPNEGFCLDAFHEMQECLKDPNHIPPSPVPPVSEPDAPPLSAPVSSSCSGGNGAAPRASSRVVIRVRPRWRLFGRGR